MCGEIEFEESNRRKWIYTWESQSHTPTLRLFLFTTLFNPSLQCHNLTVQFHSSNSHLLLLTWTNDEDSTPSNFLVTIPRVLVDTDSPINFRAFSDHIKVKLILLLPVDHRIFSGLSLLEEGETTSFQDASKSLVMESDVEKLSSGGEFNFYCRNCAFKLTRNSLKSFVEMPSTNWREVADNWFGTCCCSFGGISEKLVVRYANSYTCAQGVCLLSSTSITLCKDDVVEYNFPEGCEQQECDSIQDNRRDDGVGGGTINCGSNKEKTSTCSDASDVIKAFDENSRFAPNDENLSVNLRCGVAINKMDHGDFSHSSPDSNIAEDVSMTHSCCSHMTNILGDENSEHHSSDNSRKQWMPSETVEILENQRSFLDGYLEDVFMARASNISKDINWHEFTCPQCSSILGAYPCCEGHAPVDGGVRFFKCYISTCVPVGGAGDMFSKYTLDRMFANQLTECANDETTFRFVIRDMVTKSPVLQIILLNPDTWSCSGTCSGTEEKVPYPTIQLQPTIKVLFNYCNTATESQLRMIEEWATKNSAENIFMLTPQLQEMERSLMSAKDIYPPSCASLQGLLLSYLQR
ncbi:PREDICTED: uncharacterized protein LOC109333073 [Lupinus angustifolius]|uniref:uncharacterized protein LOC109333073 n=1 Tax=Lupinus angustifolius TaxID=3871 RepID=UPI00092EF72A|nr:PREDICTED: uncharacterized protein LOC109333073 [Lupinus angustifolius]